MSERMLNMGITFFVIILVARYLGPEKFGILSYATSLVALFAIAGHSGLSGLVVRELVKHPKAKEETMGTSFMLKGAGYLLGLVFLVIFTLLTEEQQTPEFWMLLILATSLLFRPFDVIDFWFQSRLEAKYVAISRTIGLVLTSTFKVGLVFAGAHLNFFALARFLNFLVRIKSTL